MNQTMNPSVVRGPFRPLYTRELIDTIDHWSAVLGGPDPENRVKRDGIRVFKSGFIETVFSKAHPISPILWTGPFIAWGLWRGFGEGAASPLGTVGLFLLGVFLWTFLEYMLHRYVFHWQPEGPNGKVWSFMVHGYHHEFPNDRMRLVAPPLMLGFFGILAGLLYSVLFGRLWPIVFGGTCLGYVGYDWIHYYTHHFSPKRGPGAWLRRYHLKHHFQDGKMRYGISSPLWDLVFRTYIGPDK
jgi:sterol desaturase/sphingolipid hydroxylase (fatty acid hydroxylase superfamily)